MLPFLSIYSTERPPRDLALITNATLFSIDWAESERKRSLRRVGSARACWWSLNRALHQAMFPAASLEQVMYAFHRRQHAWTFWWLEYWNTVDRIATVIRQRGVVSGLIFALQLVFSKGDDS